MPGHATSSYIEPDKTQQPALYRLVRGPLLRCYLPTYTATQPSTTYSHSLGPTLGHVLICSDYNIRHPYIHHYHGVYIHRSYNTIHCYMALLYIVTTVYVYITTYLLCYTRTPQPRCIYTSWLCYALLCGYIMVMVCVNMTIG